MDIVPQLDISTYSSQVFWFFITFTFLYLVVSKMILPRVEKAIHKRHTLINNAIDNASSVFQLSQYEILKYESAIKEAENQVKIMIETATKEVEKMKNNITNLMKEELVSISELTDERINNLKSDSYDTLVDLAVNIASLYYKELLGFDFDNKQRLENMIKSLYQKRL